MIIGVLEEMPCCALQASRVRVSNDPTVGKQRLPDCASQRDLLDPHDYVILGALYIRKGYNNEQ
jgi:hypothetical protein